MFTSSQTDTVPVCGPKQGTLSPDDSSLISLPVTCEQSAVRSFWHDAFLGFYLPKHDAPSQTERLTSLGWIETIPALSMSDPTLVSAFDALATARLGLETKEDRIQHFSYSTYGKALGELQKALRDPRRASNTETLASILLLALYEVSSASY
jgi:hypothetical protein